MTEQDLIKRFKYNGFNITNYKNKLKIIDTGESGVIFNNAIATTNTFSCSNFLVFNENFAYLVHMLPNETIGKNNQFLSRIAELTNIIKENQYNEINIIISLGESDSTNSKIDFHNLANLEQSLYILSRILPNLTINKYPNLKSKFLLFDLNEQLLIIDNPKKKLIDINTLEPYKKTITNYKKTI